MKKLVRIILIVIMVFSFETLVFAANIGDLHDLGGDKVKYVSGKNMTAENICVLDNGNICVTNEVFEKVIVKDSGTREYPDKEKIKTFCHMIYDWNGIEIAALYSTVSGLYSEVDGSAMLTSITGYYTGTYASKCSYTSVFNANTGSISACFNGLPLGSFSYKIYANGSIQNI